MLRRTKAFACLLGTIAIILPISGAALQAQEQTAGLNGHNSNAPVNYAADRIELQDKQNRVVLTGNVDITQDNLRLTADRTIVDYINDGGVKIQRIDALGSVHVTRGQENATADVANYDFTKRIITLVGNVVLRRDKDISRGSRLVIDLNAHHSGFVGAPSADGQSGRVTGSFSVAGGKRP